MDRQIVDPDPGKNYDAAIPAGDPHFEMEKKLIYIAVVQIVARPQIVMLDDTVLLRKNLARFR